MKVLSLFIFIFLLQSCSTLYKQKEPSIRTFKKEFEDYWSEAKDLPETDIKSHARVFKKYFFSPENKELTTSAVFPRVKEKDIDKKLENALRVYVPFYYSSNQEILELFPKFEKLAKEQLKTFSRKLPDFKYEELPIFGIISLGRTLGGLRQYQNKPILTFGIDQLVKTKEADFDLLFAHEAFHAYHQQVNPTIKTNAKRDKRLLITGAYAEGIATFASGYFNPKKKDKKYISADLRSFCLNGDWKKYVHEFLKDAESYSYNDYLKDNTLYSKWFHNSREKDYPFPTETGYCIGERVVDLLVRKYSLPEIAHWNLERVQAEFLLVLKAI